MMKQKVKLPCEECGGRCCSYAPIHMKEWEKIKEKDGIDFLICDDAIVEEVFRGTPAHGVIVWKRGTSKQCYFLKEGRCSIYTYRPSTCRKVGANGICAYTNPEAIREMVAKIKEKGHTFLAEKD